MEKTIFIDGQQIPLKVTAGCMRMYKLQFRRDLIRDVYKLKRFEEFIENDELIMSDEALANVDFELFADLLWVFAKKANPNIPSPMDWEDSFTSIPFIEIYPEVIELLTVLLDGQKKQMAQATQ